MTLNEVILEAAKSLAISFTDSDLIIAAWKLDKETCGLYGYREEAPDSGRVMAAVCHLVKIGALKRIAPKLYQVGDMAPSDVDKMIIERLLRSSAWLEYKEECKSLITSSHALDFWHPSLERVELAVQRMRHIELIKLHNYLKKKFGNPLDS